MQSFEHNMFKWIIWVLAVHLASAALINTHLQIPFGAIVPNQLRIYKEYTVQHKDANREQFEGLDEGQKILVNCTIRSVNVTNKETGKILKRTTANCTVTHEAGLESKAEHLSNVEKPVSKMEEEIPKMADSPPMIQHAYNSEPYNNHSDVSYVNLNEQTRLKTLKAIEKLDLNNESEQLIPVIVEAVTSHSQEGNEIGGQTVKIPVEKTAPTLEAGISRSSKEKQITPIKVDKVEQNNDAKAFDDTVKNANNELIFTSRRANNEATLSQGNSSIQQILNVTGQQSIKDDATISPLKDESGQNAPAVSGNSMKIECLNNTSGALITTNNTIVRPSAEDIQRVKSTTENTPETLSQDDNVTNHYDYSFNNSGRPIQTPINIEYKARTVNEKPFQKPLESTTKPSKNWRYANKLAHQLTSITVKNYTLPLVKDSIQQNSRNATKIAFQRRLQGTPAKFLSKSTEKHTQSASDIEGRSGFVRPIGSSQTTPDINNTPGQSRRAGNLKIPSFKVADNPVSKTTTSTNGNEYPLAAQVHSYPEQNLPQLKHRQIKHFNTNAKPILDQFLSQEIPSYVQDSRHWQRQFAYSDPQRPAYVHNNQVSDTSKWDFVNVPHQKTIWETLEDATNNAQKRIHH